MAILYLPLNHSVMNTSEPREIPKNQPALPAPKAKGKAQGVKRARRRHRR